MRELLTTRILPFRATAIIDSLIKKYSMPILRLNWTLPDGFYGAYSFRNVVMSVTEPSPFLSGILFFYPLPTTESIDLSKVFVTKYYKGQDVEVKSLSSLNYGNVIAAPLYLLHYAIPILAPPVVDFHKEMVYTLPLEKGDDYFYFYRWGRFVRPEEFKKWLDLVLAEHLYRSI